MLRNITHSTVPDRLQSSFCRFLYSANAVICTLPFLAFNAHQRHIIT